MRANSSSPDRVYLGGVRVLLVDSSPYIRAVVTSMLEEYGATVTGARRPTRRWSCSSASAPRSS